MIPVSPDIMIKYAVVAVAAVFLAFSILNYLDVRRNQNQRPKEEGVEPKLIPRGAIEELKQELEQERQYFVKEADPPKTLAEVLEELIMRRLADVSVSLTVEIPETSIKLFGSEAKLSGTVTITTQKQGEERDVGESKYPVVIEEDEAEV